MTIRPALLASRAARPQALPVAGLVLVAAIGIASEVAAHGDRFSPAADLDLVTGMALAASGALALARVPRSRIGGLLMLTGGLWFIGTIPTDAAVVGSIVRPLTYLYFAALVQAALTYPTGRAVRPIERIAVAGAWIAALLPPLWASESGLLALGALLLFTAVACAVTLPAASRRHRWPGFATAIALAVVLPGKVAVAAAFHAIGIAFLSSADIIWEIAIITLSLWLVRSLLDLERKRSAVTDLVIELDERGDSLPPSFASVGDDPQIAVSIARAREIAERNQGLRSALAAQRDELAASRRRSLEAGDEERLVLEGRLREGVARTLADLADLLDGVRDTSPPASGQTVERIERARDQLSLARTELDELARGLGPRSLRQRGLGAALLELAELSPVPVEVELDDAAAAATASAPTIYFAASEALANVARHARARHAWLRLRVEGANVALSIEDDGVGGADAHSGSGLRGLHDRVEALGGQLSVGPRDGGGTVLVAVVP